MLHQSNRPYQTPMCFFFFFNDPAPPDLSPLPLPAALPIAAFFPSPVPATVFVALFLIERVLPLRKRCSSILPRVVLNLIISAAAFAIAAILVRPAATAAMSWATQKPFGVVHVVAMPSALRFIASFLLMDLT